MNVQKDFNDLTEADVLEGYGYILNQRISYNNSNGEKGAFVVATNSSWGIDEVFGAEFPLWCAVYDSLGAHGILNVGATTNREANVDEIGDLPTTCESEYLIAVTGSDRNDDLGDFGFGPTHVDLAAPGFEIISPTGSNGYNQGTFGLGQDGTSFATPLVTGAIGLIYSAPCYNFAARAKTDPAGTALEVRALILDNVKKFEEWADKIASSGRLDVGQSLKALMNNCGCPTPYNISNIANTETSTTLEWITLDSIQNTDARIRIMGNDEWMELEGVQSGISIDELDACTTYEVQFASSCPTSVSAFSESYLFTTEGCCKPPTDIQVSGVGTDFLALSWEPVMSCRKLFT